MLALYNFNVYGVVLLNIVGNRNCKEEMEFRNGSVGVTHQPKNFHPFF
jgi:hypothetical protein